MKFAHDVIRKPVITERSMEGIADNKYVFEVAPNAGKIEIKKAVVTLTADSKKIEIFENMM